MGLWAHSACALCARVETAETAEEARADGRAREEWSRRRDATSRGRTDGRRMVVVVPPYGARGGGGGGGTTTTAAWAPRERGAFGLGGAFPEVGVVQFPCGMGWCAKGGIDGDGDDVGEAPGCLEMGFEKLSETAARRAFDEETTTREYEGFLRHVRLWARRGKREMESDGDWWSACARVGALERSEWVRRVRNVGAEELEAALVAGEGEPLVIEDGGKDWDTWTLDRFKSEIGSFFVSVNDRAPARRSDVPKQRTHQLRFDTFVDYVASRDGSLEDLEFDDKRVPFYANGMRVFSDPNLGEKLSRAFPRPRFTATCDHTETIIRELMNQLGANAETTRNVEVNVSKSLDKLFCGPKGTITRLHYDAQDAHGWLGQAVGWKLFVLYPPSAGRLLHPIEDSHGGVDPLNPTECERFPSFAQATPRVCVLAPGEVLVNPRGWWHYAVSLTSSVTVMRNFYHATTNAAALVDMILDSAKKAKVGERRRRHKPVPHSAC